MFEGASLEKCRVSTGLGVACRTFGAGPPLLVRWGGKGPVHRTDHVLDVWREVVDSTLVGRALPCGHFLPREQPAETEPWFFA